ncbi:hypothetical protein FA13DRAFT_1719066 [Coprinellus micaceus]|uniref:Uncharacterized protein n=1 Tax=Coprinellus micaceus TaxID=71717 RepID=A0A4Y7SD08_COPMI|nr:hypothetical protein FA13DRAFT_1719066 [Coprinellus micaceus]
MPSPERGEGRGGESELTVYGCKPMSETRFSFGTTIARITNLVYITKKRDARKMTQKMTKEGAHKNAKRRRNNEMLYSGGCLLDLVLRQERGQGSGGEDGRQAPATTSSSYLPTKSTPWSITHAGKVGNVFNVSSKRPYVDQCILDVEPGIIFKSGVLVLRYAALRSREPRGGTPLRRESTEDGGFEAGPCCRIDWFLCYPATWPARTIRDSGHGRGDNPFFPTMR